MNPTRPATPLFAFFATVVVIQGIHVFEHIVQLTQVYLFDVAEDDALGLLGTYSPSRTPRSGCTSYSM